MAQATKLFDISTVSAGSHAPPEKKLDALPALVEPAGPRKLIRPRLPENLLNAPAAPRRLRGSAPLAAHEGHSLGRPASPASHAEGLYFQKQIQAQTSMVFVMEDGERIEGVVEWFDRDSIKVRNSNRTLIFKRSIKYLHKAAAAEDGS